MIIGVLFLVYNYSNVSVNRYAFRHPLKIDEDGPTDTDESGTTEIVTTRNDGHDPTEVQSGNGYMLSLAFADQGTGAFVNLMCLCCFASAIGDIRIVEPFIISGSRLGLNLSMTNWKEELKFSDIFDSGAIEKFAKRHKFSDLASFGEFLKDAPRKLLVAQHKCTTCSITCGHPKALEKGKTFAELYGFEVVGQVCLEYDKSGKTPIRDIERQLYKKYKKSEITILFVGFGGLEKGKYNPNRVYRLYISVHDACYRNYAKMIPAIRPSQSVVDSAEYYIQKYLHSRKYITVMIRIERVLSGIKRDTNEAKNITEKCLRNLMQYLEKIKHDTGIADVFCCLDIGRYGSTTGGLASKRVVDNLGPLYDSFLSQTVGDGMTLAELDSRFTNTTLKNNRGFVAMMQKVIAARGDVLTLLGDGSTFQKSALEMYNSLHKSPKVFKLNNSCK